MILLFFAVAPAFTALAELATTVAVTTVVAKVTADAYDAVTSRADPAARHSTSVSGEQQ